MTTGDTAQLAYLALLLVLVGGAIVNRRLPAGRILAYLVVWAVVIGGVFLLFGGRAESQMVRPDGPTA